MRWRYGACTIYSVNMARICIASDEVDWKVKCKSMEHRRCFYRGGNQACKGWRYKPNACRRACGGESLYQWQSELLASCLRKLFKYDFAKSRNNSRKSLICCVKK